MKSLFTIPGWRKNENVWKSLGGIMVNGVPQEVPRDSIRHDPKAFPHIFIILSSRTCKEGFLSANGLSREYHGQYIGHGFPILVELNPNILVRHVERILIYPDKIYWLCVVPNISLYDIYSVNRRIS